MRPARTLWLLLFLCPGLLAPAAAYERSAPEQKPALVRLALSTPRGVKLSARALAANLPPAAAAGPAAGPARACVPTADLGSHLSRLQDALSAIKPTGAQGRLKDFLDRAFDRIGLFPARQAPTPELKALAAPWKTRLQLRRLAATPRRKKDTFRFAVIGDCEPGRFWIFRALFNEPGVFPKLMALLKREPVDFSIQLGDMVSLGSVRNYTRFLKTLDEINPPKPYLTATGNHDRRFPHGITDSKLYRFIFGTSDYYFDRGGYRFVVVNDSAQRLTRRQLAWLDDALDTRRKTLVFMHIPPDELTTWADYHWLKGKGGFEKGSKAFTEIVSRRKVSTVYLGHVHGFGVLNYNGVRYVLTGGGGSPLFPSGAQRKFHHFLTVEAGPKGIKETIHKDDGEVLPVPRGA